MALTNTARAVNAVTNIVKASFAELWSTITTSWASETRTWAATGSLMTDGAKPTTSMTNTAKPS